MQMFIHAIWDHVESWTSALSTNVSIKDWERFAQFPQFMSQKGLNDFSKAAQAHNNVLVLGNCRLV